MSAPGVEIEGKPDVRCCVGGCSSIAVFESLGSRYCRRHRKLTERASGAQRREIRRLERIAANTCTASTLRCRTARIYTKTTNECCKSHIRTITDEISEAFAREGITWWLDYGMLLGAVRNPILGLKAGIIPHDKDGDIGVLGTDFQKVLDLRSHFAQLGRFFTYLPHTKGKWHSGHRVKIRLSKTNHTNVDIFPWYRRDDGTFYRTDYCSVDRFKGREFPERWLYPITPIEWEGRMLPGPALPERFVEHRYGKSWRTPIYRNNAGTRVPGR